MLLADHTAKIHPVHPDKGAYATIENKESIPKNTGEMVNYFSPQDPNCLMEAWGVDEDGNKKKNLDIYGTFIAQTTLDLKRLVPRDNMTLEEAGINSFTPKSFLERTICKASSVLAPKA